MADLSSLTYSALQTAVGDWLARPDLSSNIPDFIMLFETEANRTLRTRNMEITTLLYPATAYSFTVTNCANNGSNLIRVTFTATSTSTVVIQAALGTGSEVAIANVNGTVEANNSWIVTLVDSADVDLQNSTFINAYTSGGTLYNSNAGQVALPSDYLVYRRLTWTGTPQQELEYMQPSMLRIRHPLTNSDNLPLAGPWPSGFTVEGGNLIVRPIMNTAVEFDYYQKIPALASAATSGSSTNWLMTTWPDAYLAGSLAEAYVFQKDYDQAAIWKQRRDDFFERITKLDQKTRGSAGAAIRPDMRGRIP